MYGDTIHRPNQPRPCPTHESTLHIYTAILLYRSSVCDPLAAQEDPLNYEDIATIVEFIKSRTDIRPCVGIICGSGLGGLAEDLDRDRDRVVIGYREIPRFPRCFGE